MIYRDKVNIITKKKVDDGMGGFTENNVTVCTILCKIAPVNISEREVLKSLNPWSSVKFYTKNEIPIDEDKEFYLEYNNKMYRKVEIIDYGKCIKIVGERYYLWILT